jgi:phage-related protein (TIGR01555 family)
MKFRNFPATRADGWTNPFLGWGTSIDRQEATTYSGYVVRLTDPVLSAMYATEDLSAKIVDVYPREALREGFEVGGIEGADEEAVRAYVIETWNVCGEALLGSIWGRLFGGAVTLLGTEGSDYRAPLDERESVTYLRDLDARYVKPLLRYDAMDRRGDPLYYQVTSPEGGRPLYEIHRSRVVAWPGALTDAQRKLELGGWDYSVLQRAYDALRTGGSFWKSAENLMHESSIGVYTIPGLYGTVASEQTRAALDARIAYSNRIRSAGRMMVLDASEKYERVNTSFAGVADLTDRAMKRIAAAAETPVTVLLGEAPAGLNATGDSDLRWFLMRVKAYQQQVLAPRIIKILRVLLAQEGSPVRGKDLSRLTLRWPPLWSPSAKEQSEIFAATSAADVALVDRGIIAPEEAASRFGEDGYSQDIQVDPELRESEPVAAGEVDPNAPAVDPATGAPSSEDVQKSALNGAQVSSLLEIVQATARKELPRDSAVKIIELAFQVSAEEAGAILGSAGAGFTIEPEPPPMPFGGGGPKPPGAPPPKETPPEPEA